MTLRDIVILSFMLLCGCKLTDKATKEIQHTCVYPIVQALK